VRTKEKPTSVPTAQEKLYTKQGTRFMRSGSAKPVGD
jgi:hypothetical protein